MPEFTVYAKVIEHYRFTVEADNQEKAEEQISNEGGCIDLDQYNADYDYREIEVCGSDPV